MPLQNVSPDGGIDCAKNTSPQSSRPVIQPLGSPTLGVPASHLKEASLSRRALGRVAVHGVEKRRQSGLTAQPLNDTEREIHEPVMELFTDSDGAGYVPGVDGSIKCG
jgi:hypothetical protein